MRLHALVLVACLALAGIGLSGCLESTPTLDTESVVDRIPDPLPRVVELELSDNLTAITLEKSVVDAAISYGNDLYEPTMEVSADGTLFVTGHTILVDTTGAPVFGSWDDGASWEQLPFTRDLTMPNSLPGATPPPSDEIFLVAGDEGWLYGVDITLATFPVNGWNDDGRFHAYHNPNAYDEHQVVLQADECTAAPLKDRPWAAYANGALLMVSNPAAGPAQIGVMEVPTGVFGIESPYGVGATAEGGRWNVCAGLGTATASSRIPGIPDMRDDGLFAVPQKSGADLAGSFPAQENHLYLILGNKENIHQLRIEPLFAHSTGGEITSVYGQAAFDAEGDLFVGITNNTAEGADGNRTGQIRIAVSTDDAKTFQDRTFVTGQGAVRHMYMDGNRFGPGSLVVWAVDGESRDGDRVTGFDWYMAHVQADADGLPVLENVSLVIDEGPQPSAHVTGAALGPDGRAYTAMFERGENTPVSVFIQRDGPTAPVTAPVETDATG